MRAEQQRLRRGLASARTPPTEPALAPGAAAGWAPVTVAEREAEEKRLEESRRAEAPNHLAPLSSRELPCVSGGRFGEGG